MGLLHFGDASASECKAATAKGNNNALQSSQNCSDMRIILKEFSNRADVEGHGGDTIL